LNVRAAPQQGSHDGFLESSLVLLKQTDFFTWFHLSQVNETQGIGSLPPRTIFFKPTGKFRDLVTVQVLVDGETDRVTGVSLIIARSFIDSPVTGIFARDITWSLLEQAPKAIDRDALRGLAMEIHYRDIARTSTQPILSHENHMKPAQAVQSSTPTPGYLTFVGMQKAYKQALSDSEISFANTSPIVTFISDNGRNDVLAISLTPFSKRALI